jgi:hypothetical protein
METNYDRIMKMSIEELAQFLSEISACSRCLKRGNSCFPGDMEMWLMKEVAETWK